MILNRILMISHLNFLLVHVRFILKMPQPMLATCHLIYLLASPACHGETIINDLNILLTHIFSNQQLEPHHVHLLCTPKWLCLHTSSDQIVGIPLTATATTTELSRFKSRFFASLFRFLIRL